MKTEKQLHGIYGEDLAVNLLLQKGYKMVTIRLQSGNKWLQFDDKTAKKLRLFQ